MYVCMYVNACMYRIRRHHEQAPKVHLGTGAIKLYLLEDEAELGLRTGYGHPNLVEREGQEGSSSRTRRAGQRGRPGEGVCLSLRPVGTG